MPRKHRRQPRHDSSGRAPGKSDAPAGAERLQKVLAAAGVGSRRDCEELIREGRVQVDRQVITELGTRVDPLKQEIRVDGETLRRPKRLYFAVNKPSGVVTTNYDPSGRPRVIDLVPTEERVFAVGRLDRSSEGLIVVTNDGEFANRLTHPRYGVSKTYLVRVAGAPSQAELAKLRRGIHLAEGLCRVESLHVKGKHKGSTDMIIVLNEGRNREIRRLLARVGHKVVRLKRIAIGKLKLADLPVGAWRRLMPPEIEGLLSEAKRQRRRQPTARRGKLESTPPSESPAGIAPADAHAPANVEDDEELLVGDEELLVDEETDLTEEFGSNDEPLIEIREGPTSEGRPRGEVIDYEEPRPAKQGRPQSRQQRGRHGRQENPEQPGRRRWQNRSGRAPQSRNRPGKQRRKGRR